MSGRRSAVCLLGIAVVAGSFAALALASTKTINDPRDVKCYQGTRVVSCAKTRPKPADIKTVTAKTGNGKIRFQITSYNAVMHKLSGGINGSPAVQVLMKVGTKNFI